MVPKKALLDHYFHLRGKKVLEATSLRKVHLFLLMIRKHYFPCSPPTRMTKCRVSAVFFHLYQSFSLIQWQRYNWTLIIMC